MTDQVGGDALPGERRQHADVRHGCVVDDLSAGQGESAGGRVGGADELISDEYSDGTAWFEQRDDLAGWQVR
jgi:hypothetical protein